MSDTHDSDDVTDNVTDEVTVDFSRQIREAAPEGIILAALEIRHPEIEAPVRVVNDTENHTIEGNAYQKLRFEARLSPDVEGRQATAEIVMDNIGMELNTWIERARGGLGATVRLMILPAGADAPEWEAILDVTGVSVDQQRVSVRLGYDPLLGRPAVAMRHDPETSPGLF